MEIRIDFDECKQQAEQGDSEAQYKLGVAYFLGEGVVQNYKESVKWTRKAAEQGHADAQYDLGLAYYLGQGIEQDSAEAISWIRKNVIEDCVYREE
jgi:uncharacterized protein